jgi:hypothetical protein
MLIKNWYSEKLEALCKTFDIPKVDDIEWDDVKSFYVSWKLECICTRFAYEHEDKNFPKYSVILIQDNSGGLIAKGVCQKEDEWMIQKRGVVIVIDVHELHHCIKDTRLNIEDSQSNGWVGYGIGYSSISKIPNNKEIEELFFDELMSVINRNKPRR